MAPAAALDLIQIKLREHGLASLGWTGSLDNALRRFGGCDYRRKHIVLSRHLATINTDEETLDTVLHEIAHALAFEEFGEDCGHDARWQAIAARIGARPERTVDVEEVSTIAGSYFMVHSETGEVFRSYYQRPHIKDLSKSWIRGRRAETEGKLAIITARELARLQSNDADDDENPSTIRSFDQFNIKELSGRVTEAIKAVCQELGLTVEANAGRYNSENYRCSYTFRVPRDQAKDGDRAEFELYCHVFDLSPEHFGAKIVSGGKTFELCGFKPQNRKYPVIGRDAQGKRYKFPQSILDQLRNTSPLHR